MVSAFGLLSCAAEETAETVLDPFYLKSTIAITVEKIKDK